MRARARRSPSLFSHPTPRFLQLYTLSPTLTLTPTAPATPLPSTLRCVTTTSTGRIATGTLDGRLAWWEADGGKVREVSAVAAAHAGGVQALASAGTYSHIIASGGEDGSVGVWDGRTKKNEPALRLNGDDDSHPAGPVWSVALPGEARFDFELGKLGNEEGGGDENLAPETPPSTSTYPLLALAGHSSGLVRLWCLRTGKPRWAGMLPGNAGACGVAFSPDATAGTHPASLFAAATGGLVVGFEAGTQHPETGLASTGARLGGKGGREQPPTVWGAHPLASSRNLVACPCGDGRLRLLRYGRGNGGRARVEGKDGFPAGVAGRFVGVGGVGLSPQALTCFAWCGGYAGLWATGGLDEAVRVGVVPRAGVV